METVPMSAEERAALRRLLATAARKGGASEWWRELVKPLNALAERLGTEGTR